MSSPATDAPTTDGASRLGQVVSGRYRIQQLLGEGGMGAVYLAEHTHMRKRVALKLLHPEMNDNAEVLARFEREAMAASHIEHPNVAAATDFGRTDDGGFFLVLEYLEGVSLRDALAAGPMPTARALHIARQISLALDRAHAGGVVHRDLKPENVMLVKRGDDPDFVKVLDFGIAKVSAETIAQRGGADQPLTRMGTVLGTPEYMAPEQAMGEAVTARADLYALGIILYEMLTGLHPFDPPDRMAMLSFHIVAPVPAMADRAPAVDVPPAVEAVVRRLLEKDASKRHASARELVDELEAAGAASGFAPGGSTPAPESVARPPAPTGSMPRASWAESDSFAKTSVGELAAAAPPAGGPGAIERALTTLQAQPRGVLIAVAAAMPIGFLIAVVLIISSLRTSPANAERAEVDAAAPIEVRPRLAPEDRLRAAGRNAATLEALREEFPEDPAVTRSLALAYRASGRNTEAMKTIGALLAARPEAARDDEIVQAVVSVASQPKGDADDEAFALLEGPLGARGVDALLEMTGKGAPAAVRSRAAKSLARPEVRARATPAAALLIDLRGATSCQAKKELLDRAREHGDKRAADALTPLKSTRGCGFLGRRDCWPCMRKDAALEDALEAIAARQGAP